MSEQFPGVLVKGKSANRKLGPVDEVKFDMRKGKRVELKRSRFVPRAPFVASTYLSIQKSCDDVCAFKNGNGCFAESGYSKLMIDRLDEELGRSRPNLGVREAEAIDKLFPHGVPQDGGRDGTKGRDLRLHVSGDAQDDVAARALGMAAMRYVGRGGGTVWTYTHSWRHIPEAEWGPHISVMASVETAKDANKARYLRNYVPALVIREFPSTKVFSLPGTDVKFFPCLAETQGMNCAECRACFDTDGLKKKNLGVAFAVHGMGSAKAKKRLSMYGSLFGVIP